MCYESFSLFKKKESQFVTLSGLFEYVSEKNTIFEGLLSEWVTLLPFFNWANVGRYLGDIIGQFNWAYETYKVTWPCVKYHGPVLWYLQRIQGHLASTKELKNQSIGVMWGAL